MRKKSYLPFFSVIIPTFNRAYVLPRTIKSVLNQTFSDFELIIVDDGSTDDTKRIVDNLNDGRIIYIRQENKGRSVARNNGISRSSGRIIIFLDSDDEAMPDWIEEHARAYNDDKTGIVCSGARVVNSANMQWERDILPFRLGPLFRNQPGLFLSGTFSTRKKLLEMSGAFIQQSAPRENTELALRLVDACIQSELNVAEIPKCLIIYYKEPFQNRKPEAESEAILKATKYILSHHSDRLIKEPATYAVFYSVAGVNASRLRRYAESTKCFFKAVCLQPSNLKHYARLTISFIPFLARKFWLRYG